MNEWASFSRDLIEQWPLIANGLGQTLLLATLMSITGLLGGIVVLYLTLSPNAVVRWLTRGYISFFIGMPLIVLLFLMYYGLPQWGVKVAPFWIAVVGFTMNIAAYNAGHMATAYNGLDPVELESARAQGFSHRQVFEVITLPQVLRLSVPALTNQIILNLKDTSVAFLIQYTEFFARIQELAATNFQFFKAYMLAAGVYLGLVSIIVLVARLIERRILIPGTLR